MFLDFQSMYVSSTIAKWLWNSYELGLNNVKQLQWSGLTVTLNVRYEHNPHKSRRQLSDAVWVWLIKNRQATTLKLIKPICNGRHRRWGVTVYSLFNITAGFPFQKQVSNHRPILLFFHFSKIRGRPVYKRDLNKTTSTIRMTVFPIAVYSILNFSYNSGAIGRWD